MRNTPRLRSGLSQFNRTYGFCLGIGLSLSSCSLPVLESPYDDPDAVDRVGLDPRSLFEERVKPELNASCQVCHQSKQVTYDPFLIPGDEYNSITNYAMSRFLTAKADESSLLTKGAHQGPALTAEQQVKVRGWLENEAAARGTMSATTPVTPSMPVRLGDYNMNLKGLVGDPLARLSFSLTQSGSSYSLKNLALVAGPSAGVQVVHPRLLILTASGATPEPNDAFSTLDLTAPLNTSKTLGSGNLLLASNLGSAARIAFVFASIKLVPPNGTPAACKNIAQFDELVRPKLALCASLCHGAAASDPQRSAQARLSFDLSLLSGTTAADKNSICVDVLARALPVAETQKSLLIRQVSPYDASKPTDPLNGTPNHPFYKINTASELSAFRTSVQTWASGAL